MTPRAPEGPPWGSLPTRIPSLLQEFPILISGLALFYGLLSLTRYWTGQVNTQAEIHLVPAALPKYAFFSLTRIGMAYLLSLVVAVGYGYAAARYRTAERFQIPLLDTLQSIPVLSFLPPVMVGMVALFPTRQLGVQLGSIVLIFTGQVWNMAFSVYASMRNIPREMLEAAEIYRMSRVQRFFQLELPYSAIGLVWNSMMSVPGGWFFLMACELFVLGNRDFRLPGLGSYLQTPANAGDTAAILWGVFTMIAVIVLIDQGAACELFGEHAGGAGARACFAIAHSGPVVGADLDKSRDLRLNCLPLEIRVAKTGIQNHQRTTSARAVEMHLVTADIDEPAGHGVRAALTNQTKVLIEEAAEWCRQNEEGEGERKAR